MIEIKTSEKNKTKDKSRLDYFIKTRTGRTWGGSKVSYILVEYFNDKFNAFLDVDNRRGQWDEGDFIYTKNENGRPGGKQDIVISFLEEYVEELKKCIDENYKVTPSPRLETQRKELVKEIRKYITPSEDSQDSFEFEVESELEGFF